MKCFGCGNFIPNNCLFCPFCGNKTANNHVNNYNVNNLHYQDSHENIFMNNRVYPKNPSPKNKNGLMIALGVIGIIALIIITMIIYLKSISNFNGNNGNKTTYGKNSNTQYVDNEYVTSWIYMDSEDDNVSLVIMADGTYEYELCAPYGSIQKKDWGTWGMNNNGSITLYSSDGGYSNGELVGSGKLKIYEKSRSDLSIRSHEFKKIGK